MMPFNFSFFVCTTIWPKIMILIDLFLLFAHDRLTKIYGLHSFISFIYTRPFDQNIWHSFIYSFFCKRPFDQNLGSSFIYSLFSGRPSDQKLGSSFIYFFSLHTTIRPKYRVHFHLFFLLCTTIWPKNRVFIDLFHIFAYDNSTKMYRPLSYTLPSCTTIRPKISVLINLYLLFVYDHSTKIRVHFYSLIYFFLNCPNILYAIFMAVLPL